MSRYAENTQVGSDRSRAEIERTLVRYGATAFSYGWDRDAAAIQFVAEERQIRFVLPLPDRDSREFTKTPTGKARTATAAETEYEKAVRQRWRALALMVKAKLEGVAAGIVTFEEEFLPHVVLPSGRTVYQEIRDDVADAYLTGAVTPLAIEAGT